jgi:2-hydroxychromene-2-carboxylate isomerase
MQLKAQGTVLSWHPFDHKPLKKPASFAADEDRAARHRRVRGEYIALDIQRYAPHPLRDIYLHIECASANLGLIWLQQIAPARVDDYVCRIFQQLWRDHVDISDLSVITEQLQQILGEAEFAPTHWHDFVQSSGSDALDKVYDKASELGVTYAPTFFLGEEPFQGRAQLPLISARLNAGV